MIHIRSSATTGQCKRIDEEEEEEVADESVDLGCSATSNQCSKKSWMGCCHITSRTAASSTDRRKMEIKPDSNLSSSKSRA